MEFIKLNYRQVIVLFFLCVIGAIGTFGVVYFISPKTEIDSPELADVRFYATVALIGFCLCFFLLYFLGGMYNFYRARKFLLSVVYSDIFDDSQYTKDYKISRSLINYNGEWIYGSILGYPTIVSVSLPIDGSYSPSMVFSVCIIKFNETRIENISFPIGWKQPFEIQFSNEVFDFVSAIIKKGYPAGDLLQGMKRMRGR